MYEPRDTKDTGHARGQARLFTLPLYSASLLLPSLSRHFFPRDYLESSYFDLCDDSPKQVARYMARSRPPWLLYCTPRAECIQLRGVNTCIIVQRR